jgi:hypothetical protein
MLQRKNLSAILYSISGLLGILSLAVFTAGTFGDLAPAIKLVDLLLLSGFFLAAALWTRDPYLESVAFVLSPASYLSALYYFLTTFQPRESVFFLALVASAGIFLFIGSRLFNEKLDMNQDNLKYLMAALLLSAALFTSYDLSGPGIEYTTIMDNSTEINVAGEARLGNIIGRNGFSLPRLLEPPSMKACIYPDGRLVETPVLVENSSTLIESGEVVQSRLGISVEEEYLEVLPEKLNVSRSDECPLQNPSGRIVVTDARPERPRVASGILD